MYAKKGANKKMVAVLLAVALLIGCGIGGTLAWLMDTTPAVTNTFTVGNVDITLVESPYEYGKKAEDGTLAEYGTPTENVTNNYPMIPGNSYKKDPVVTVTANSEDCYLFVKLNKVNNPDNYLTYTFNSEGWTPVKDETDVYYRTVDKNPADQSWELLTKDTNGITVIVKDSIVKTGTTNTIAPVMPAADKQPQLIFTAYAVQQANRTVAEAWNLVKPTN